MLPSLLPPVLRCACRAAARAAYQTVRRRGPLFGLIGRPAREPAPAWVDGVCSPLPLTVALLLAHHLRSGGGGLTPIELLRDLQALWPGDEAERPTSIAYLRAFPSLFVTEFEARARDAGRLHPRCVRLSPAALALAEAAAAGGAVAPPGVSASASASASGGGAAAPTPALQRLARALPPAPAPAPAPAAPSDPAAARALLASLPLQWLPELTPTPCAATWGPLLVGLLQTHGAGPTRRLPLQALLQLVQDTALARCLPLPPSSAHWFALSPSPSYERLRPLWEEQVRAERSGGGASSKLSKGLVAVELVEEGRTALQEDLEALRLLAAQVRARKGAQGGGGAGGAAAAPLPAPASAPAPAPAAKGKKPRGSGQLA